MRSTLFALFVSVSLMLSAAPARPGIGKTYTQPDGKQVTLILVGDEHNHFYLSTDNKPVFRNGDAFYYGSVDADGLFKLSDVMAHDIKYRQDDEVKFVKSVNADIVAEAFVMTNNLKRKANSHDGVGKFSYTKFPTEGHVKSPIFLVEFEDVKFYTENPKDYFDRFANEEGFSENGHIGSVKDYFVAQSRGKFIPEFDVLGPVTLPHPMEYYGGNTGGVAGNDKNPKQMMLHASMLLDDTVDFTQYDADGDGYIDNIMIIYPGVGENVTGAPAESIWPHSWTGTFDTTFDGLKLSRYACVSELSGTNTVDGIGTFCHEFSHVLGLPDLYNTVYINTITPCLFSVMDQGCYQNSGRGNVPTGFSSFERNALGWMGDDLIIIDGPASCRLESLTKSGKAYMIPTAKENEFFLFENRQNEGYDTYLPAHGMLIWHIDFDKSVWDANNVNNNSEHMRVDLVEACNTTYGQLRYMARYSFPGTRKVDKYIFGGTPNFKTWDGENLDRDITNIVEEDGIITFDVAGGGEDPAGIEAVSSDNNVDFSLIGRTLAVTSTGKITVSDIAGRVISEGNGALAVNLPAKGIYIVKTVEGSTKIVLR